MKKNKLQTTIRYIQEHYWNILIWGIIAVFTLLYITLVFNYNISTDEAFTMQLIEENSYMGVILGTAEDVHPPLYYLLIKPIFDLTGGSLWVQKFITIIPQVATMVLIATVFRKRFGDVASFMTLLYFTCIPSTMEFTVQVRMYTISLLFVTMCAIYAYEAYMDDQKSSWILLTIGALGAAYCQYFSFVSIIIVVGFLFLAIVFTKRELLKRWFIAAVVMIVGYLPWMPFFVSQVTRVREDYWIEPITFEVFWGYFEWTFDLEIIPGIYWAVLGFTIMGGVVLLIQLVTEKEQADKIGLIAMLVPTFTCLSGVIISMTKSPIYSDRYIFSALMLLAIFFGISYRKVDGKILTALTLFFLFVGAVQYKENIDLEYNSSKVPQTLEFFEQNLEEDDVIIYNLKPFGFIYERYFDAEQLVYIEDFDFSDGQYHNVWFLNTTWCEQQIEDHVISNNGLVMDLIGNYGIEHNDFDIYMIYRNEY